MFYFSCGEMLGPILGSLLVAGTGNFVNGISVLAAIMLFWCIFTAYHLAGYVICKVERPEVMTDPSDEGYSEIDDESPDGKME